MEKGKGITTLCKRKNFIVLIGCGKKKIQRKTKAEWLYQGQYYYSCLSLARLLTNRENIFILSAKYGMIPLEKMIEPYELKITSLSREEKKRWVRRVIRKLKKWPGKTIIFICGKAYHSELEGVKLLPNVGMGEQMQWMSKRIKELKCIQL